MIPSSDAESQPRPRTAEFDGVLTREQSTELLELIESFGLTGILRAVGDDPSRYILEIVEGIS